MSKLLYAGFRRYFKSLLFWLALAASVVLGLLAGVRVMEDAMLDDIYVIAGFIIFAVLLTFMIGREYGEGGFKNKLATGHTRGTIIFSEYIVALSVCLILSFAATGVFAIMNASDYSRILPELMVKSAVGYLFLVISMITMIFFISVLVSQKAVAAVLALLLVLGLYMAEHEINLDLNQPEYRNIVSIIDGKPHIAYGSEKNPQYVDSPLRENLTFIVNLIPMSQAVYYNDTVVPLFDPINIMLSGGEDEKILNTYPLYSIGTTLVFLAGAFVIFRKKDLK